MNKVLMLLGPVPARELSLCRGHEGMVFSLCNEDGKIVSGSRDGSVVYGIWRAISLPYAGAIKMSFFVCVTKMGRLSQVLG